ncbi:unnamed protein product, partial [Schistocephalus solidus]|uniref:BHLH domain-containing protein n=1 Tax=Schistocephalus solidus TaxID=70667 RepID=A0A183T7P6_SCHSO
TKVVVARQLNVGGPEAGSAQATIHPTTTATTTCVADAGGTVLVSASPHGNAVSVTTAASLPPQVRPTLPILMPRPSPPGLPALAPATQRLSLQAPQSSLSALRAFNQSQARSSRTARSRSHHLYSQIGRRGRPPPLVPAPALQTTAGIPVTTTTIWTASALCASVNRANSPSLPDTHTTLTANIPATASPAPTATSASVAAPVLSPFTAAGPAPSVHAHYALNTSTALYTTEVSQIVMNSSVSTTPSTTTPTHTMRFNQGTLDAPPQPDFGAPLILDGYTNQSSTSDTMKSLLNAIMRTVPPSSDEAEHQLRPEEENQREQDQHHDFNSLCQLDLMYPSPAAGNSSIPFPVVLGTPENTQPLPPPPPPNFQFPGPSPVSYSLLLNEDSCSSLGTVITGLSQRSGTETLQPAGGEASLSDSLACKILMEMSRPTVDDITFTTDVKPATTDGAILTDRSEILAPDSDGDLRPNWFPHSSLLSLRSDQEVKPHCESVSLTSPPLGPQLSPSFYLAISSFCQIMDR